MNQGYRIITTVIVSLFFSLFFAFIISVISEAIQGAKPLIFDLGVSKVVDYNFQTALVYRYSINGKESVVFLETEKELFEYKLYLSKIGDWYTMEEDR